MSNADFGLVGLAVMGENLVLNMESRGFRVAVFNRTTSRVDEFIKGRGAGKNLVGTHSLKELVAAVEGAQGEWIVFENPWGAQLVFDRKKVTEGQAQVLETYRIPTDRSADLGG